MHVLTNRAVAIEGGCSRIQMAGRGKAADGDTVPAPTLYWGFMVTDDDLRDFGIEESCIKSCLQTQIDFLLVCDPQTVKEGEDWTSGIMWAFARNLNPNILASAMEHKHMDFRGERKSVILCWH